MNKRIPLIMLIIALIIGGVITAYAVTTADGPSTSAGATATPTPTAKPQSAAEPSSTAVAADPASAGQYLDYNDTVIADSEGTRLLFFHAPWCPQCRSLESDIETEGVPSGITIIKVDYDSSQDLRQRYGVTQQTTFVEVNSAGEQQQKFVAFSDPSLSAVLAAMLSTP
ncbi:MAG: thioredoxin family protein [Rhodoglobus sp.]